MKSASFRRELKNLWKSYQRSGNDHKVLDDFFEKRGILIRSAQASPKDAAYYNWIPTVQFILRNWQFKGLKNAKRLSRLCRRLGNAALKQGKQVRLPDIIDVVMKQGDARNIEFVNPMRTVTIEIEYHVKMVRTVTGRHTDTDARLFAQNSVGYYLTDGHPKDRTITTKIIN